MSTFSILLVMSFIFLVIEFITKRGLSIWFAIGFLLSALLSNVFDHLIILTMFGLFMSLLFMATFSKSYRTRFIKANEKVSETDNLVGLNGVVIRSIHMRPDVSGRVKIGETEYQAIVKDSEYIPVDSIVVVVEIDEVDDNKLIVREIKDESPIED